MNSHRLNAWKTPRRASARPSEKKCVSFSADFNRETELGRRLSHSPPPGTLKIVFSNQFFGWIKCRAQSFAHAGRGLFLLCLTQWNFRIHLVAGLGAICLGCYFRISPIEWLFLIAAVASVLCAEALNTALERTVDLIEPQRQPVARDAKDLAAAGVLIASLCSLIVGVILFGPRLVRLLLR